jgi:hypothetical protein
MLNHIIIIIIIIIIIHRHILVTTVTIIRVMLVKNNILLNMFINVHLLVIIYIFKIFCNVRIQNT